VVYAHEYFPSNLSKEIVPIIFDTRFAEDNVITNYGCNPIYSRKTELWLKKFCINRSTLVTITTPEDVDRLLKHIPEAENKVRIIPMYLPYLEPIDIDEIINKHNEKTIKMLFVGNDVHRKGLDLLLKVFNRHISWFMKEKIEICIISNFRDNIHLKEETKKFINKGLKLKILSNISWEDVQKLMHRAHIFIFPTRADTYGLVLMEAMAGGTTIITSNNSPQKWIVNYGESGLSINSENIDQLFESMKKLIYNKAYRLELALNAHNRFLNTFHHKVVGEKLREVFWEAIELKGQDSRN
jgi:glycosyltransferase involved in cell wall biosynthesis